MIRAAAVTNRSVAVRATLAAIALGLGATACGGSSDDAADRTSAASTTTADDAATTVAPAPTEPPAVETVAPTEPEQPAETTADTRDDNPLETLPTPEGDASTPEELQALLPEVELFGPRFTEEEVDTASEELRAALEAECPGTEMVAETPPGTVGRAYRGDGGLLLSIELLGGVVPMTATEEAGFLDALNSCHVVLETPGGITHSLRFSAGSDDLGDQGVRGALTDSVSGGGLPEPVGVNTYFVRVVVGDVAILVRGSDSFDGVERVEFDPADVVRVTQAMVLQVEDFLATR